ncbi:MAG: hypothetical protein NWS01_11365, partial [Burkholderiales bacterium]|nr:hypothetical protein [Burkholderiales bacterium]
GKMHDVKVLDILCEQGYIEAGAFCSTRSVPNVGTLVIETIKIKIISKSNKPTRLITHAFYQTANNVTQLPLLPVP